MPGSKAFMTWTDLVERTYVAGSGERHALERFVADGLDINKDRPACLLVVKALAGTSPSTKLGTALKQAWNL